MSLTRQLWIAIAVIITLTFVSGFLVSNYSARSYYVEQLTVKNIDNATGLALSLSQMEKDPVTVELMIAAQFDTGHYQRIELIAPDGETMELREHPEAQPEVPAWFARLMAFDIPPGVAQVQDGWNQYGTLYIESQSAYALAALWRISWQLLAWFLVIALACGLLGSILLRRISQPLQAVVEQAEAIGERRFITSKEPRTLEFMRLVRAMNTLTRRVRGMLEAEARRLDEIRQQSQLDPLTGVANREQLLRLLDARLSSEDTAAQDGVLLIRLTDLQALNQKLGRAGTDAFMLALLAAYRERLDAQPGNFSQYNIGRLNGSDFVVLLNDCTVLEELAGELWCQAKTLIEAQSLQADYPLAQVGSYYQPGEPRATLLSRLDDLLAKAEQPAEPLMLLADEQRQPARYPDAASWRQALHTALSARKVGFASYPVRNMDGGLYHQEAMLRIHLDGEEVSAGAVIGWARRLQLLPQLDLQVLEQVIHALDKAPEQRMAVNLSAESLHDAANYLHIVQRVENCPASVANRLALEINEQVAVQHPTLLSAFSTAVKSHGAMVGLQSAGKNISAVPGLEKLGLDYMKVDASLIQQQDDDVRKLLRGLCKLGRSLGLHMIAEGVLPETDQSALAELGFDALTGPGVEKTS